MITLLQNSSYSLYKRCTNSSPHIAKLLDCHCFQNGVVFANSVETLFEQSLRFTTGKRFTSSVQESQLYSIDQIRQNESPWVSNLDIAITDRKVTRPSFFKKRLQERKKIRILYGHLSDRKIDRYLSCVDRREELIVLLESRLDVVCRRCSFFQSILCARQSIVHGGISVNSKRVLTPGYQCMPGDLIQVIQSTYESKYKDVFANSTKPKVCMSLHAQGIQNEVSFTKRALYSLGAKKCRLYKKVYRKSKLFTEYKKRVFPVLTSPKANPVPSYPSGRDRSHYMFFDEQLHKLLNITNKRLVHSTKKYRDIFAGQSAAFSGFVVERCFETSSVYNRFVTPCIHNSEGEIHAHIKQNGFTNTTSKKMEKYTDSTHIKKKDCVYLCSQDTFYSRPLHLEISYTSLSLIFLYPPQKVCVDITLDFDLL